MPIGRPPMVLEHINDVVVLSPGDDLTLPRTQAELDRAASEALAGPARGLVLNLDDLSVLPSNAIGVMIQIQRRANEAGKAFVLVGLHRRVASTLSILGVDSILRRSRNVETALEQLRDHE